MLDTIVLSRVQFGFTIGFHILFPTLNIGLALFLVTMEGLWLKTKNPIYLSICRFWTKIFALTFGMGVVSGIVLSYELGTNFGPFINAVGGVLGPLFAYEVLSAFFLEAGFLGVMLFGWERVTPRLHFSATLLVMVGTTISAFWILSANSWMQTPAGYHIANGRYIVDSWWQVIFNPSFMPRYLHMLMASYVTTCFVIAGVSAWHLLKGSHIDFAKRCLSFALGAALILAPLQVLLGDLVGIKVYEHQPLKTAAMEGIWQTQRGAPLVLFAIPDTQQETNRFAVTIPYGASLINTHHADGEMLGLSGVAASDRPAVMTTFFMFRIMVGIGFLMLGIAIYAAWLRLRKKLFTSPNFLRLCILVGPLGFISTIAGWMTAESGRQPWIVYNLMRTAAGAAAVPWQQVFTSLILFILVYGVVFSFYLIYTLRLIKKGPAQTQSSHSIIDKIEELPFKYLAPEVKDQ